MKKWLSLIVVLLLAVSVASQVKISGGAKVGGTAKVSVPAGAALGVGNVTTQADNETTATLTFSHNNNGNYLLVDVAQNYSDEPSQQSPTGVTYNGVALTEIGNLTWNSSRKVTRWRLISPTSGANNVVVSWSTVGAMVFVTARSFTGVNTSTPEGTTVTASGSSTAPSVNASSATGELVVDVVATGAGVGGIPTISVDGGQTQDSNGRSTHASESLNVRSGTSHENGAGTVTMSWTVSESAPWGIIATPLKP